MRLLKYSIPIWVFGIILGGALMAEESSEADCDFEQPILERDYWPILTQNPEKTELKLPPAVDVFVGKDGVPLRFALLGEAYQDDKEIINFTAQSLGFKPAYACGEAVDGFYRHLVRSYFYVDKKDVESITDLPIALFTMPKDLLNPLELLSYRLQNRTFNLSFVLNKEGIATNIKGMTKIDQVVVDHYFSNLLPELPFQPAKMDGEPVEVKVQFRVDMSNGYSSGYLDGWKIRKPMPSRRAENAFPSDKTYSILLEFYPNGAVSNIQFLTLMNREESLATLNAFRNWKIKDLEKGGIGISNRLKVVFGFVENSDEAVLISEEFGEFLLAPRPIKQPPPVYPPNLRRKGYTGVVIVQFHVNTEGRVKQPQVIASSHEDFSAAAIAAVIRWRFKPGTVDGNPVTTRVSIPIPFQIRN